MLRCVRYVVKYALTLKVAPYSYLKFWVFYAIFGLAKFTTNTLKTRQSD